MRPTYAGSRNHGLVNARRRAPTVKFAEYNVWKPRTSTCPTYAQAFCRNAIPLIHGTRGRRSTALSIGVGKGQDYRPEQGLDHLTDSSILSLSKMFDWCSYAGNTEKRTSSLHWPPLPFSLFCRAYMCSNRLVLDCIEHWTLGD